MIVMMNSERPPSVFAPCSDMAYVLEMCRAIVFRRPPSLRCITAASAIVALVAT